MAEEIFDVCDEQDRVIGQAPRSIVHEKGLLHRAVHIWVFRSDGRLMLHRRSLMKDEYPDCYTSSASGHLSAGEDYDVAAPRELEEELGLRGELRFLVKLPASSETANEHTVLYRLNSDEPPTPDPGEIAAIEYEFPTVIHEHMATTPERFTPPFRKLMDWYRQQSPDGSQ